MELLQLLLEASSLSLTDLKKAIQKDKRVAPILKAAVKLEDISDKEAFLATLKYLVLNNENVKHFVSSRSNIKDLTDKDLSVFRKLRANELDEQKLEWLHEFVKVLFKEHNAVQKGTLSRDARKEVDEFVNSNGHFHTLRGWVQKELASIPGIRPSKRTLLYRGVLFSEHALKDREKYDGTLERGEGLKFLSTIRKGGRAVDLEWDRPSSWTTSREVARRFAMYGPAHSHYGAMMDWFSRGIDKRHIDGALGYVISTYAKPEDVLINVGAYKSTVHHQHGDEGEMILKPGKYLSRVVEKHTVAGEVDPSAPEADLSDSPALKGVASVKELLKTIEKPSLGIEVGNYFHAADLIKDLPTFKKLVLNSTTTEVMHAFDKLMQFYKKELSHIAKADTRADKYAHDEAATKAVAKLKKFIDHFDDDVTHSKFATPDNKRGKGKKHDLSSEEYRSTIKPWDITSLERDLLTRGKVTDRDAATTVGKLSRHLGKQVDTSHLHQMGPAKQDAVLSPMVDAFYKAVGVDKPSERTEAYKGMFNLLRKAYRNAKLIDELNGIHATLEELK